MTYEAFLKKLGLTTGWSVVMFAGAPWIRRADASECPIAVVAGMPVSDALAINSGFRVEGCSLSDIMYAADGREGHDPAIRNDLLVACGLASTEVAS